ncbi:MAG: Mur ligase family protein, partial [Myxococcota bacterium]|nr:Mur ligase family protein [Myxococcota bacterium]
MQLSLLLQRLDPIRVDGRTNREVSRVTHDSREVTPDALFVAIRGQSVDARGFVPDLDVACVVADGDIQARPGVTTVLVSDARRALPQLAAAISGDPGKDIPVVGITGTNGKTTITWMLEAMARSADLQVGIMGTTGHRVAGVP